MWQVQDFWHFHHQNCWNLLVGIEYETDIWDLLLLLLNAIQFVAGFVWNFKMAAGNWWILERVLMLYWHHWMYAESRSPTCIWCYKELRYPSKNQDCSNDVYCPTSVCMVDLNTSVASTSFTVQLGRNEVENKDAYTRYWDFEKWMRKECLNSSVSCATKFGKKRWNIHHQLKTFCRCWLHWNVLCFHGCHVQLLLWL